MAKFEISNQHSGLVLGVFEGATGQEALDAMARDAGYSDYAELQREVPAQPGEIIVREMTQIDQLIRDYAARAIRETYGEDETPAAILTAICEAQTADEAKHLGRALLERHEALADAPYRYGGERYPDDLRAIAEGLGWEA